MCTVTYVIFNGLLYMCQVCQGASICQAVGG
jgi:hypothetical protein